MEPRHCLLLPVLLHQDLQWRRVRNAAKAHMWVPPSTNSDDS